jgi:hypothetical protein
MIFLAWNRCLAFPVHSWFNVPRGKECDRETEQRAEMARSDMLSDDIVGM